jgi:hypothetical protein
MQRRMVGLHTPGSRILRAQKLMSSQSQLSKEDEVAAGGEEVEVRRDDQDKINKFSRLHQREINLEEELKSKHVRIFISKLFTAPF